MSKHSAVVIASARQTIMLQAEALQNMAPFINESFTAVVDAIIACNGRVVVSGVGKSAIIAQKLVATLNSTGTPALYMHAADAIHGDLGMVQQNDVVLIISKSGNSPEIKVLVPLVRSFGNIIVGMVGNTNSYLAKNCTYTLNTTVQKEACPNNLAPTTSTTAQMVMGDALAICLMEQKKFTPGDFARFHPGGALGKQLYLRVGDLLSQNEKPAVYAHTPVKAVIMEITKKRLGATAVVDENQTIVGVVTDGDVRRMLEKYDNLQNLAAENIMNTQPKQIDVQALAAEAFEMMKDHNISQLLVTSNHIYAGVIHLHDLMREGII